MRRMDHWRGNGTKCSNLLFGRRLVQYSDRSKVILRISCGYYDVDVFSTLIQHLVAVESTRNVEARFFEIATAYLPGYQYLGHRSEGHLSQQLTSLRFGSYFQCICNLDFSGFPVRVQT